MQTQGLLLGREVRLVLGRVEATIRSLGAGARARGTAAAVTRVAARLLILGIGPGTVALTGRASAARAAGTLDGVLGAGLLAVAVQRRLLAAGAGGLLGTDALGALAAAGGRLGGHCCCGFWECGCEKWKVSKLSS